MEAIKCGHRRALRRILESYGGASWIKLHFALLFLAAAAMARQSAAAIYKVGDSAGWTSTQNVNYSAWAESRIFRVGDILVFEYNAPADNVVEVTREGYHNCSALSPLASFSSGNDSVVLQRSGHRFFLSGYPAHCAAGQRVDIRIPRLHHHSAAPASSPSFSPSPVASSHAAPTRDAPGFKDIPAQPQPSGGAAASSSSLVLAVAFAFLPLAEQF